LEPADSAAVGAALREEMETRERAALYPTLLRDPDTSGASVAYYRERAESRLITVALVHGSLTSEQYAAIGAFRLRQYVLCGLYDALYAAHDASELDPSMESLAPQAIHVCCGTPDGRLLSYMCMETAKHRTSVALPIWRAPHSGASGEQHVGPEDDGYRFGTHPRPLFATEFELFGPWVFATVPYLRERAITQARELSRMLRNQMVTSPLSVAATIEIIHAMFSLATNPALDLRATLGCLGREGRALLAQLGVPVLYAPDVPVVPQQVAQARATRSSSYWSDSANAQGQFWPFVVASADLRRNAAHFAELDNLLRLKIEDLRRALVHFRRAGRMIAPVTLLPNLENSPVRWTADATDGKIPARAPGPRTD
jgi:hypothetical protein